MSLAGFGAPLSSEDLESHGCKDAFISESHLTLAFSDRVECWDLEKREKSPSWCMDLKTQAENSSSDYGNIL